MATDLERLTVSLEANVKKFERELARARGVAVKSMKDVEDQASSVERALSRSFGKLGGLATRAFAGIATGLSLNELRKTADDYTKIINSLKVAGVKDGDLQSTFDKLFASAQTNAAPLDALATLYGRVSAAQTTLKATSGEVMQVTDIVAQSLRVGGTSATEASGALLQLGQALAGGKVQAEEYNSLLDGMRPLLEAAAAGLKEAGGDVAKLTGLVKDGKVSSEAFFRAIIAGSPILEQKLAGSATTTEQAMQRMKNELTKAVGEFDRAVGVTPALAAGLDRVAGSIGSIGQAATTATVATQGLITKLSEAVSANLAFNRSKALSYQEERGQRTDQAREMGLANSGGRQTVANERSTKFAQDIASHVESDINSAFDIAGRQVSAPQPAARPAGIGQRPIKPVSLADFSVPGEKDGGGGGGSSKQKLDAYERETAAIRRRTTELDLEAKMVGKGTFEREKSRAALDLENAAKKAGIPITQDMRKAIDEASTGYANAKVRVEEATKALDAMQDAQRFLATELTDGFIDAVLEGENLDDVIKNITKSLAKAALQAALMGSGPLAGLFGASGSNGAVGGLLGLFAKGFDDGGYTGPGSKNKPAGIVHKGEVVWSKENVRRAGGVARVEALRRGYANGGPVGMVPPRIPTIPAGVMAGKRGQSAGSRLAITVDVRGATGNEEIQRMVAAGMTQAVAAAKAQVGKDVLNMVSGADRRMRL